mmetsp:Transcript_91864/g.259477  ORF Transcript_91864/g.259477 Transcript_91864/m.259477 type:complete len:650 (+) Transcript_91864:77-2026(+)
MGCTCSTCASSGVRESKSRQADGLAAQPRRIPNKPVLLGNRQGRAPDAGAVQEKRHGKDERQSVDATRGREKNDNDSFVNEEFFPMTVVPMRVFMGWSELQSFGVVARRGEHVKCPPPDAIIIFLSHQWLAYDRPDPNGVQLAAIQRCLKLIIAGDIDAVMDSSTWESFAINVPNVRIKEFWATGELVWQNVKLSKEHFAHALSNAYIWIDYSSIPQVDSASSPEHAGDIEKEQAKAIQSIPFYVERSSYFFVVAPRAPHEATGNICDLETWGARGWCRLEEWATNLRKEACAMLVVTESPFLRVATWENFHIRHGLTRNGAICCGDFTCCQLGHTFQGRQIRCDKVVCKAVVTNMWQKKVDYGMAKSSMIAFCLKLWSSHMFTDNSTDPWSGGHLIDNTDTSSRLRSFHDNHIGSLMEKVMGERERNARLVWAGLVGSPALIKDILEARCDPYCTDVLGRTALHNAVLSGNIEAATVLLEAAPESLATFVNRKNKNACGFNPILRAADQGHEAMMKLLLYHRAEVDVMLDNSHSTALHLAAENGFEKCARLLLDARIDAAAKNINGRTALHFSADPVALFGSSSGKLKVTQMLFAAGLSATQPDNSGVTPLDIAGIHANTAFVSSAQNIAHMRHRFSFVPAVAKASPP